MGIQVEFNPDLALRKSGTSGRTLDECVPENLEAGKTYAFLKKGQRNYWLQGEIPLLITEGEGRLSRPVASIRIIEARHRLMNGEVWTDGRYEVMEVFNPESPEIHFESYKRVK